LGNFTGARDLYRASLLVQPSAPALVAYALLELRRPQNNTTDLMAFEHIERLFEEAVMLSPRHGPAYNAYARCVFEQKQDVMKARDIYERGVRANCTDVASIYHGYGRLELALGNVNRAREIFLDGQSHVNRLNLGMDSPHRERALFLTHTLGMLEFNSNRPSSALDVFSGGIERYGNSSQLLLGAALCEVKLGNERMARLLFEQSVLNDENHAQAWHAWGVMEMRAGKYETAKTLFECGIKTAPKHGALWQAYGTMQSRLGNIEHARALFERGIRMSPTHVQLYQSWSSLELREENLVASRALIAKALTLDKRNGHVWLVAAEIEEKDGNFGLANLLLRRGIECSPSNPRLYRALGDSLVKHGKIIEAREVMEKGIEVDPLYAPLYHSLAELEARVFNIEGLAKLNKRAASIFNANVLEPSPRSSEMWGSKIRAGRARDIPKGVAALAQRIVDEDHIDGATIFSGYGNFLDELMISSSLFEDELVGELLLSDEKEIKSNVAQHENWFLPTKKFGKNRSNSA
jgi:tetratricopeptide (TPR) repeat protein